MIFEYTRIQDKKKWRPLFSSLLTYNNKGVTKKIYCARGTEQKKICMTSVIAAKIIRCFGLCKSLQLFTELARII